MWKKSIILQSYYTHGNLGSHANPGGWGYALTVAIRVCAAQRNGVVFLGQSRSGTRKNIQAVF